MAIIDSNLDVLRSFLSPDVSETIITYLKDCNQRLNEIKSAGFNKTQLTDDIYGLEQVFEGVPVQETVFEAHRKHVDIQFMLDGFEIFGLENTSKLNIKEDYDSNRDIIFYKTPEYFSEIKLMPGWFAIYFPSDSHLCRMKTDNNYTGVKAVVKVPFSFFNL